MPVKTPHPAREASLRFSSDATPGISREPAAGGFVYVDAEGGRVTDDATIARIEALRIPPAWTNVWICPDMRGHLQATGRDARGRKQYRYHDGWRAHRDATKFGRMVAFGEALPSIRARVAEDLARHALSRARVLAAVVRLLDESLVRIGNPEYRRDNESYGLTTLGDHHVAVSGAKVTLSFRGKAGKDHVVSVTDRRLARVITRVRDLPGEDLFQYQGADGRPHRVTSGDVNDYLREAAESEFTSKDFRTWGATAAVTAALREAPGPPRERAVVAAVKSAARLLGNTPAVCRRSYVHPGIIGAYLAGDLDRLWAEAAACEIGPECEGLREEERVLLELLRRLPQE